MQIRVDKLRRIMTLLQPVVPKNPTLKVITNIRFMDGNITATDLETAVSVSITEMNGDAFLLPFKPVMEVLKYVPGDLMLTIEHTDKSVKLSWNGGSASYLTADIKDYPSLAVNEPVSEAVLNGDVLIGAMAEALYYCARENTRPVLTGVALYLGDVIQVAGADGFRVSFESLKLSYPVKQTIIVPPGTVNVLEHLWHKEPGQPGLGDSLVAQLTASRPLALGIMPGHMTVKFGNISVVARLIEGTPPDVLQLLSNFKEGIKVKVLAPELYNAVRRLKDIAKDGRGIVKLQWTDAVMTVSASSSASSEDESEVLAEIPVLPDSQPGRVALNIKYLLEYLAGKDGFITMGTESRTSPVVFHFGSRPLVAVMPMLTTWGDEPKPEEEPTVVETENPEGETNEAGEEMETAPEETEPEPETEPVAAAPKEKRKGGRKKKA